MLWSRKPAPPAADRSRHVGLDLTASRVRGASVGGGRSRPLVLDEPAEDLALFLSLERRAAEAGRAGYALARKVPHLVCSNFLPALGQPREWRAGRLVLTPDTALETSFAALRDAVTAESDAAAMALPAYLTPAQANRVAACAAKARLPLMGTVSAPLAVVGSRAAAVLAGGPPAAPAGRSGVVPLHRDPGGPGSVVVLDADEFALSGAVVAVEPGHVRHLAAASWPRLAVRAWKDRLIDAVADRCVRLCRRDPRDSADAEQALFEQLDDAMERAVQGKRVGLTVRTAHWFQDVVQQPDDFDGACAALARQAVDSVRDLIASAGLTVPPRAVWLTPAAGRLPGLLKAVHAHTAESTAVEPLPPSAVALAVAHLVPRWLSGELPRTHLDTGLCFQLSAISRQPATEPPKAQRRL